MIKELIFWVLMLFWLVLGVVSWRVDLNAPNGRYVIWGGNALFFFLFLVLGWAVFGAPMKG
jgi:hypothetical protein